MRRVWSGRDGEWKTQKQVAVDGLLGAVTVAPPPATRLRNVSPGVRDGREACPAPHFSSSCPFSFFLDKRPRYVQLKDCERQSQVKGETSPGSGDDDDAAVQTHATANPGAWGVVDGGLDHTGSRWRSQVTSVASLSWHSHCPDGRSVKRTLLGLDSGATGHATPQDVRYVHPDSSALSLIHLIPRPNGQTGPAEQLRMILFELSAGDPV